MARSEMIKLHPARPARPARPALARLLAAAAAFVLPALLLGGLMSIGSAEAEPAPALVMDHQAAPAAEPLATPPAGAPQKVEATKISPPPLIKAPVPPVAKKPRKHRLLPVGDFGGY